MIHKSTDMKCRILFILLFFLAVMLEIACADKDFPAEARILADQPAGEDRDKELVALAAEWGAENPAAALDWIMLNLPEGNLRSRAMRGILRPWMRKDPPAAFGWVEKIRGQLRVDMIFDVGSYWASVDLNAATERIFKKDIDAYQRDRIIVEAAHVWAEKDPAAATEWAMKLPEGKSRNYALMGIASVLAMKDPAAASEWAMKLPEGDLRKLAEEMVSRQKKYMEQGKTIEDKLASIVIGHLEFKETSIQDAVEQLNKTAIESDPDKSGVKISLDIPVSDPPAPKITASLENMTLGAAVRFVCRMADLQCRIEKDMVTIGNTEDGKTLQNASLTADPETGKITVETDRYTARIDAGILTFLYNKLTKTELIGAAPEVSKTLPGTALIVQEAPLSGPVFRRPAFDGNHRSKVTIDRTSPTKLSVTFRGLAGDGKDKTFFPEDTLSVTVSVDGASGDLLVRVGGSSAETPVAGTAFGFSGLTRKFIVYLPNDGGAVIHGDTENEKWSPLSGTCEWCNKSMAKRTGSLAGNIWCAPVTVIAAEENPKSAFAVWCEDDELLYKHYVGGKKSVSYTSLEYPPYEKIRATRSVTWHINTYAGGWSEAAKPYADSLARRGFTKNRATWAKDISVIVQMPDLHPMWWKPLMEIFPPEYRKHILLYAHGWRNQGFDRNHWDYTPSPGFLEGAKGARDAGFHTLVYFQPTLCWGDSSIIADQKQSEAVRKMQEQYCIDPFGKHKVDYTGLNIAYTPWRRLMLDAARNAILNYDVQGAYQDSTFTFMPDGRGRIEGMTSYEGMHRYIDELRKISPDIFMGTEYPNELMAWGTDFGLHTGLEWAVGYERSKARNSHPILNYLFRDVMVSMIHANSPTRKFYHYCEEITERTGQVAALSYDDVSLLKSDSADTKLWIDKAKLFAGRGLRPYYPDVWEPGVMSYLKAEDGTIFAYMETGYGSKLVERAQNGPVTHYGRVWEKTSLKTDDGKISNWIGLADDGTWIGLAPDKGYVLIPQDDKLPPFRITQLPEGVSIKSHKVNPASVTFHLTKEKAKADPAPTPDVIGKTVTVPIRFRAPGKPEDIRTESSKREAKQLLSDKKDDSGLEDDMLSDTLMGLKEIAGSETPDGKTYEAAIPLNEDIEIVWGK